MQENKQTQNDAIAEAFSKGRLIVYPTEAVMGIGCDPDNEVAVHTLLQLKQRDINKGMILIADTYSRLLPYVNDSAIPPQRRAEIFSAWPGPVTWLLPKSNSAPYWLTGAHEKIAVRVTTHPVVIELCRKLNKPLVSTSANPSGEAPAMTLDEAKTYFGDAVTYVEGDVLGRSRPSTIKDGETGAIVRN